MNWELPVAVSIGGMELPIRSDYRAALDICAALSDPELCNEEKIEAMLTIFYPDIESIPPVDWQEAVEKCCWFLDCGQEPDGRKAPRLVDWEQDFQYICGPINRVLGNEVRSMEYLHWWSFIAAYMEIGDCTFAQTVRIRDKLAHGKTLDKHDHEWYRQNRRLVDFKRKYTSAEQEILRELGGL